MPVLVLVLKWAFWIVLLELSRWNLTILLSTCFFFVTILLIYSHFPIDYHCNLTYNLIYPFCVCYQSYANAVISSLEDPEKVLEQTVLEMNDDLIKMRHAAAQVSLMILLLLVWGNFDNIHLLALPLFCCPFSSSFSSLFMFFLFFLLFPLWWLFFLET